MLACVFSHPRVSFTLRRVCRKSNWTWRSFVTHAYAVTAPAPTRRMPTRMAATHRQPDGHQPALRPRPTLGDVVGAIQRGDNRHQGSGAAPQGRDDTEC